MRAPLLLQGKHNLSPRFWHRKVWLHACAFEEELPYILVECAPHAAGIMTRRCTA